MKIIYRNLGIVIIHGFGGNTNEIEPLSKKLKLLGYPVLTPVLKGHDGNKKVLRKTSYKDWIKDVEEAYLTLKKECQEVILIGFSMGGLLSLQVARKFKVKSIITLNTPIFLGHMRGFFSQIIKEVCSMHFTTIKHYIKTMARLPFNAYINFNKLLKETKKTLHEIKCDILINQAYKDDVVNCKSADYLHEHVKSQNKKLMYYHNCSHLLLHSEVADDIIVDCVRYIESR